MCVRTVRCLEFSLVVSGVGPQTLFHEMRMIRLGYAVFGLGKLIRRRAVSTLEHQGPVGDVIVGLRRIEYYSVGACALAMPTSLGHQTFIRHH